MRARAFVFALVVAVVLAVPAPAHPTTSPWSRAIWSSELDGGPSGMTTDDRGAIVTTDAGWVRAIDRHGATQWQTKVDGVQDGYPAVSKDLVLVGGPSQVVALGRRHGAVRWQRPMDADVHAVALAGAYALAGDSNGTLRAFAAADGAPRWADRFEGELFSSPRVDQPTSVVLAVWHEAAPTARALDLATGALRWEQPLGLYTAGPGLDRGRTFFATGDGRYHAWIAEFDVVAGVSDWTVRVPASFQSGMVPAVNARDLVFIDQLGRVIDIDPTTGTPRWSRDLNRRVYDSVVVLLPRRIVVTTLSGELFVLDRVSGRVVARADTEDFGGRPSLAVAFGRRNQVLVALRVVDPGRVELRRVP